MGADENGRSLNINCLLADNWTQGLLARSQIAKYVMMNFLVLTKVNLMRLLLGPVPQLEPCHNICIQQVFLQI